MPHLYLTDIPGRDALMKSIHDFVAANGWTVDLFADDTSNYYIYGDKLPGKRLHFHFDDFFIHMRSATLNQVFPVYPRSYKHSLKGLALYVSDAFDGSKSWRSQPNRITFEYTRTNYDWENSGTGPCVKIDDGVIPACHIFLQSERPFFCVSVEYEVGKWRHLLATKLIKSSQYIGGEFICGSNYLFEIQRRTGHYFDSCYTSSNPLYSSSYVRAVDCIDTNVDSEYKNINGWIVCEGGKPTERLYTSEFSDSTFTERLLQFASPTFSGSYPLIPWYQYTENNNIWEMVKPALLGEVPYIKLTSSKAFRPGEIVHVGGVSWIVLPVEGPENEHALAILYDGE